MSDYIICDNLGDARRLQRMFMDIFDLPLKGRNVGRGRHVYIEENPINMNARHISGYTTRYVDFVEHLDGRLAARVTDEFLALWLSRQNIFAQGLRDWLQNKIDTATELSDDWKVDDGNGILYPLEVQDVEPE